MTLLYVLNLLGVGVFAISGVLAAGRKRLDLLGVVVLAMVTAIGGGTLRDLLLDRHPIFWIREPENLLVIILAAVATLIYLRFRHPPEGALLVADALGLAVFAISGTQVALDVGLPGAIAVIMGVITGVAGGVVRDVLSAEIPLILRRGHLYATAAVTGATLYLLMHGAGIPQPLPSLVGVISTVVLRLGSIRWGLHLPVFALGDLDE
ncbi:MAG TPA: trimeric intracellular cation channel family protein [Longimicrobiaceae bacterium]|nr:trimeric intracellular cation channel family protein [Longimicrobiaceae bacterium]